MDVDLGWVWVVVPVIGGLFDAVVFGEVSFHDTGIGSVTPLAKRDFEYFRYRCFVEFMRGESPPV